MDLLKSCSGCSEQQVVQKLQDIQNKLQSELLTLFNQNENLAFFTEMFNMFNQIQLQKGWKTQVLQFFAYNQSINVIVGILCIAVSLQAQLHKFTEKKQVAVLLSNYITLASQLMQTTARTNN